MKEQAKQLWGWIRHHRMLSFLLLIGLLAQLGIGVFWMGDLVRFGLPPLPGQNCGNLESGNVFSPDGTARADATLQPLTCFWQAYQTCRSATISQTRAGTDAGHTDTVTIERQNLRCVIYGHEEYWANVDRGSGNYLCTQLSKEGDDLNVFGCDGDGSFTLYARDVTYESYLCGIVNSTTPYEYRVPQEMEACFYAAYQHCLADSLVYFASVNAIETERDFYIDNHCGIAYSPGSLDGRGMVPRNRGAQLAACASLESRDDGLHFLQCGSDGDIFLPNYASSF